MEPKKVSIILPTHNGAKFIRSSIDSCLNQTYKNIEVVIVDDASTDKTAEIISSYTDKRIHIIRHPVNKKLPAALNTGFAASCGEYLTWTSDDNYFAPHAIKTMADFLESHAPVSFVYANYYSIDSNGMIIAETRVEHPRELFYRNCIGGCFLYRRKVYEAIGAYDTDSFLEEDYDYWFRVRKRFKMKNIPAFLYYFRTHDSSLTSRYPEIREEKKRIVKEKHWSPWEKYCHRGIESFQNKDYLNAGKWALVSLFLNPFQRYSIKLLINVVFHRSITDKIAKIIK
jgi:glycosyltransferase involved in cell wall biosynthesis